VVSGQSRRGVAGRIWRLLRLLVAAIFLLVLVVFALSNRQPVAIGFWPTDLRWDVPLSIAVLVAAAVALLLGAAMVWISELGQRRRARRAEATVRLLEEQVQELKARLQPMPMPPPGK
jgi:lipopolysaccharide assembly protein A